MKILYCNKYNFPFSGTEAYLFDAMKRIRASGHDVALFSMADARGPTTPYDRFFVSHKDFKSSHSSIARLKLAARAIYSRESRDKLRAMLRDFRPDVAHVRNIYHHLSPSILWELKAQNVPVLYHVNDFKVLCPSYNMVSASGEACERCLNGNFLNVLTNRCYHGGWAGSVVLALEAYVHSWIGTYENCVDVVLAPSEFVKQILVKGKWDPSRIEVLPHFQDVPSQVTPHPGPKGTVLFFGRLSREKGISDLLRVTSQFPHLQFVIAGDGPLRRELEAFASDHALGNVSFAGHLSGVSLGEAVAKSQFTVFPSHAYETFGKTILESYAHARPVIASDLGSRRELVVDGQTGLLYPPGDTGKLAAAISSLSQDPEVAQEMGERARQKVIDRYSPEQHLQILTSLYTNLADRTMSGNGGRTRPLPRVAFIGGRGIVGKYSGIESFYEEAGRRLATNGFQVTAYCRTYFTLDLPRYEGIRIVRLPTIRSKHFDTFVHTLLSTMHACFSDHDIVHFHTLGPSLFCWIPRLFGKKTIVSVQGLDWQRRKWGWTARQVLKAGEWASARLPDRTITVSRTLQNYYLARYSRATAYVPNGTGLRQATRGSLLARLRLTADSYVLFLGRFSPEKNCDMLIEVFEQLQTPMKLVLAGGSSHTDAYVTDLRRHSSDRVVFVEWLSGKDLDELLSHAALFVLPSDLEGLSLALLDAMGAGICVLASDAPENCEAIASAGFTFRRGDPLHLHQMLSMLLGDEALRLKAGKDARERVRKYYLWDDVTQQLQGIYMELAGTPAVKTSQPRRKAA